MITSLVLLSGGCVVVPSAYPLRRAASPASPLNASNASGSAGESPGWGGLGGGGAVLLEFPRAVAADGFRVLAAPPAAGELARAARRMVTR